MHTSFNYSFETAAAEISAFLTGEMPARGVQYHAKGRSWRERAHDHEADLHFVGEGMQGAYLSSDAYRAWLISQRVIKPNVGQKMLRMDDAARVEAERELADFYVNGAYADRGIVIDGGRVVHPEDARRERQDNE